MTNTQIVDSFPCCLCKKVKYFKSFNNLIRHNGRFHNGEEPKKREKKNIKVETLGETLMRISPPIGKMFFECVNALAFINQQIKDKQYKLKVVTINETKQQKLFRINTSVNKVFKEQYDAMILLLKQVKNIENIELKSVKIIDKVIEVEEVETLENVKVKKDKIFYFPEELWDIVKSYFIDNIKYKDYYPVYTYKNTNDRYCCCNNSHKKDCCSNNRINHIFIDDTNVIIIDTTSHHRKITYTNINNIDYRPQRDLNFNYRIMTRQPDSYTPINECITTNDILKNTIHHIWDDSYKINVLNSWVKYVKKNEICDLSCLKGSNLDINKYIMLSYYEKKYKKTQLNSIT